MAWSSAFDTWGRIALSVGGWFKRWWKWLLGGAAFIGAFLLGVFLRPKPMVVDTTQKEKKDAEDAAEKRINEIQRVAEEREKEIVTNANKERTEQVADVRSDTAEVKDDLNKTNTYLLSVGDEMRKP
jgi:hypothetical protein